MRSQDGQKGGEMKELMVVLALASLFASVAGAQPTRVPSGAKVFIESSETQDSSNSKNKAQYGDFGLDLTAALYKKKVPVTVVTDIEKADYVIRSTSTMQVDSTGVRAVKMLAGFGFGGRGGQFEGSVAVIEKASSAVVFSYSCKKGKSKSAAEAFAKNFGEHIQGK